MRERRKLFRAAAVDGGKQQRTRPSRANHENTLSVRGQPPPTGVRIDDSRSSAGRRDSPYSRVEKAGVLSPLFHLHRVHDRGSIRQKVWIQIAVSAGQSSAITAV